VRKHGPLFKDFLLAGRGREGSATPTMQAANNAPSPPATRCRSDATRFVHEREEDLAGRLCLSVSLEKNISARRGDLFHTPCHESARRGIAMKGGKDVSISKGPGKNSRKRAGPLDVG